MPGQNPNIQQQQNNFDQNNNQGQNHGNNFGQNGRAEVQNTNQPDFGQNKNYFR